MHLNHVDRNISNWNRICKENGTDEISEMWQQRKQVDEEYWWLGALIGYDTSYTEYYILKTWQLCFWIVMNIEVWFMRWGTLMT